MNINLWLLQIIVECFWQKDKVTTAELIEWNWPTLNYIIKNGEIFIDVIWYVLEGNFIDKRFMFAFSPNHPQQNWTLDRIRSCSRFYSSVNAHNLRSFKFVAQITFLIDALPPTADIVFNFPEILGSAWNEVQKVRHLF